LIAEFKAEILAVLLKQWRTVNFNCINQSWSNANQINLKEKSGQIMVEMAKTFL
jgi:hypothetical protein